MTKTKTFATVSNLPLEVQTKIFFEVSGTQLVSVFGVLPTSSSAQYKSVGTLSFIHYTHYYLFNHCDDVCSGICSNPTQLYDPVVNAKCAAKVLAAQGYNTWDLCDLLKTN
ncbi:hypothetical protein DFA_08970 [Cavenderia fasciculata]|uniref:Uncharacterized protein n=1 Tax=Cavenderia fasciculata TaxID=261658 RepID=F4Q6C2_CACFS|nr:uncharacterized protein DFA_08970 [Cavenderia fasciculata]EGG16432.1 hypothetical protein DFA_08970 [Cavenderia fasciculata]|eukprot:XP_004354832.1 hypothetical protein DFA_08970 [Cavenderia fasciculata]